MAGRAEFLYGEISNRSAIDALIGEPEDGHLDCKEWPVKEKDAHEMFAKAVAGLANADGGVLIIGMRAKGDPDLISEAVPVPNVAHVQTKLLGLVGHLVEPPIIGIQSRIISEIDDSPSGFVVILIPRSDGPPHRSRKDSRFYVRVGSITLPMEYWQIEERFGARPHPKLALCLEIRSVGTNAFGNAARHFVLGLTNTGLGIAKFPGVQFKSNSGLDLDQWGIDGNAGFGIRRRPSEGSLIVFGGGVDDVIYPGQTLLITKLLQPGRDAGLNGVPADKLVDVTNGRLRSYNFPALNFVCEVSCEGSATVTISKDFQEHNLLSQY